VNNEAAGAHCDKPTTRSILDETDSLLARLVPRPLRVPLHSFALRAARRGEQRMLARLNELCPRVGRALDIGANHGLYTYALVRRAQWVDAFEPQAECVRNLSAFASRFAPHLTVHGLALSDADGTVALKIPWFMGRLGRATISGHASIGVRFDRYDTVVVPRKRLDEFEFSDVSFIKIDVEGHEERVLAGAAQTIDRCRPTLLVEIEQRHLQGVSIAEVFARIEGLGYYGGFFRGGSFRGLDVFDVDRDQNDLLGEVDDAVYDERYSNMFLFRPH